MKELESQFLILRTHPAFLTPNISYSTLPSF
jgi:hypothetical protein